MFSSKRSKVIAAGIAAVVIAGGSYGIVDATSSSATTTASSSQQQRQRQRLRRRFRNRRQGSNAQSGPAAGGSAGTVSSVSASGFTLTTATGQKVTIKEASSTTYEKGTSPASVSAVTAGAPVLVLGTTDSTTITATQVIVDPPSSNASSPGGQVTATAKGTQGSTREGRHDPVGLRPGVGRRSPAARPRTRPPKPRWPSTQAASSTGS